MKRSVKLGAAAPLSFLSGDALASDPSGIIPLLLGAMVIVTLMAVGLSWIISLFFNGTARFFVRWLPVAILWAPVPSKVAGTIFPAAFVFLDYGNLNASEVLAAMVAEAIAIAVLLAICWHVNRKRSR
ncbi:MAG: hypothetical protein ACT4NL_18890 [Pseudomarimonas sp.]